MRIGKNKRKLYVSFILAFLIGFIIFKVFDYQNSKIVEQSEKLKEYYNSLQENSKQVVNNLDQDKVLFMDVIVASKNIKKDTKITKELIEIKKIKNNVPAGAITNDFLAIGKVAKVNFNEGELIFSSKIEENVNEELDINLGMRAITIPIDYIQGLASYLSVGSHVDIISTSQKNDLSPEYVIENIEIIDFESPLKNSISNIPITKASALTFHIPAKSAENLVNAMVNGKLQIIIRNKNDKKVIKKLMKKTGISTTNSLPHPPDGVNSLKLPEPASINLKPKASAILLT